MLLRLFASFFKIGLFTFGGGWAMIAVIEREIVDNHRWISKTEFLDLLAVAQAMPGILAVNISSVVGDRLRGLRGGVAAALGTMLPSFLIILAIAVWLTPEVIKNNVYVSSIFRGIRPAVVALIVAPVITTARSAGITWRTAVIPLAVALLIVSRLPVISNPIVFVVLGASVGYVRWKRGQERQVPPASGAATAAAPITIPLGPVGAGAATYLKLIWAYLKIGLFGFGGGYAMLSLIQREVVEPGWITTQQFTDIVAISQMTPGPIGINSATYIGYVVTGSVWGSLAATLAVVLPPFVLTMMASRYIDRHRSSGTIQGILAGLRPVVVGLIASAALLLMNSENFGYTMHDSLVSVAICIATFCCVFFTRIHPIAAIIAAGIIGLLIGVFPCV